MKGRCPRSAADPHGASGGIRIARGAVRTQLSLRTRLLLAVGAIALLALILADFAVYASLRSYLYTQEDSMLRTSEAAVARPASIPSRQHAPLGLLPPIPG